MLHAPAPFTLPHCATCCSPHRFALAKSQSHLTAGGSLRGRLALLRGDNELNELVAVRRDLQNRLRTLVDRHAPKDQVGWWQHNQPVIVSQADLRRAGMYEISIALQDNKRVEDERAVLSLKQSRTSWASHEDRQNRRALVWIPGWNDSFFHVHLLPDLLDQAGMDVFALDLRRCGRARFSSSGRELFPANMAHDSHGFREYFEEIDAVFSFLNDARPLPRPGEPLQAGGCGQSYDEIILYGHSTGGLIAALYAKEGRWRNHIAGCIFNSPFWSFNLPWYQTAVVSHASRLGALIPESVVEMDDSTVLDQGGEPSEYSEALYAQYKFTPHHKSRHSLTVTAGWTGAVAHVQSMLEDGQLHLTMPLLVLYTEADGVLASEDIDRLSDNLTAAQRDGKDAPYSARQLVERVVETSQWDPSCHDVLAAPSRRRVEEAMGYILDWTRQTDFSRRFPIDDRSEEEDDLL